MNKTQRHYHDTQRRIMDSGIYPYASFLSVNLTHRPFLQDDKIKIYKEEAIEGVIVSHLLTIARRACDGNHIYPIVGYNYKVGRRPHYHAIILSEHKLDFENVESVLIEPTIKDVHLQPYDRGEGGLIYTRVKHTPFTMSPFCSRKHYHACKGRRWRQNCPYTKKINNITKH